jgi:hypothetical protein
MTDGGEMNDDVTQYYGGGLATFEDAIDSVLADLRSVLMCKQHDYGPGNILDFGEYGVLVRANDKMARLKNLLKNGEAPANEALEDTWIDLANYGVIALMVRRGLWGLPMEAAHGQ